ncbi:hypothetical protein D3C71_2156820 [compost metagenome]
MLEKYSTLEWPSEPVPGEANVILPGSVLASARKSAMFLAGNLPVTASTLGTVATLLTGTKSLIGSYLRRLP